jgi:catechol 2,3-dioxygenase-like lactoylglutathione lyase family enzyme
MLRQGLNVLALVAIGACELPDGLQAAAESGAPALALEAGPASRDAAADAAPPAAPTLEPDASAVQDARTPADGAPPLRAACSGCAGERRDPSDMAARVHHIHLNVKSLRMALDFYVKFFKTEPIWLNDRELALWAEPMLFLLQEVEHDFPDTLTTGLEHVGLGSRDPVAWFEAASPQGVRADPRNGAPDAPALLPTLLPPPLSSPFVKSEDFPILSYVYVEGPHRERIEVWSSDVETFWHVHFMTADVDAAITWYQQLLGAPPVLDSSLLTLGISNGIALNDEIVLFFASWPEIASFEATDDRPLGHIAFSVNDLDALFARARSLGLAIVSEPAPTPHGFRSFFARAPDKVLVELVEAGPFAFE